MSSSYDSEDLDGAPRKRSAFTAKARHMRSSSSVPFSSEAVDLSPFGEDEPPRKRQKQSRFPIEATRVVWEDSDGNDTTRKTVKEKSSDARKQALRSTRKAKAIAAENYPPSKKSNDEGYTGVGRRTAEKRKTEKTAIYDENEIPSDEEGMDHTMPDYVQDRRNRFNERAERLKDAGLALPPDYGCVYFSDNERLRTLPERPVLPDIKPPSPYKDIELPYSLGIIPAPIAQYLRDYQVKGAAFLHELFVYQKGGILGDDMGLGKTIQVIAFLTAMYGKTGDERDKKRMRKMRRKQLPYYKTLIVCPGSLMANWQDELERWGWWHVDLYHGSGKVRDDALAQAKAGMLEIMITTYTTYRIHHGDINTVQWDCVIADECHVIKERKSEITKAMNQVNSLCRVGLTGTAIQNKYEELWTLLNWSSPGRFGLVSQWKYTIAEPLKMGQSHNATGYELARARKVAKQLVQNLLPQFFLRRMKTLIKDQLPKKTDRVVFCPLTPTQQDAYQNFLHSEHVQKIKNSSEYCDCESGKKAGWCCHTELENGDRWQAWVFPCIAYLQRLSNHLALLIPSSHDSMDKQSKDTELIETAMPDQWKKLVATRDSILNYSNPEFCGKWKVLKKLLKFWHGQGDNKILVFSHSVRLLKMLQQLFVHTDYNVSYLDGSLDYDERYTRVKEFNSDPDAFVFLISTRAGGVGLNITSANKVVIVDPNWNPSHDLQAQDRAYRIGQTRDVEVYRLVSQGTMEEAVYARQVYKQQQANIGLTGTAERRYFTGVQGAPARKGEIFGLSNLFAYHDENVVLRDIVHKTNVAEARAGLNVVNMDVDEEEISDGDADEDGVQRQRRNSQQEEKEDKLLSQIAASITGETKRGKNLARPFGNTGSEKKKHDPVQAILASAGVSYTHENSEVIGESRVEAALSKRAAASTYSQNMGEVFVGDSQSRSRKFVNGEVFATSNEVEEEVRYLYRPPDEVKRRQFGAMAKWAGFEDVVEFALVVESYTQGERREFLDKWYKWRRDKLVLGPREEDISVVLENVYQKREVTNMKKVEDEKKIKVEKGEDDMKIQIENGAEGAAKVMTEKLDQIVASQLDVTMLDSDGDDEL